MRWVCGGRRAEAVVGALGGTLSVGNGDVARRDISSDHVECMVGADEGDNFVVVDFDEGAYFRTFADESGDECGDLGVPVELETYNSEVDQRCNMVCRRRLEIKKGNIAFHGAVEHVGAERAVAVFG